MKRCAFVVGCVAVFAGCAVPLSTSTPQSPRTAGTGAVKFRAHIDYPAVDALETVTTPPDPQSPTDYPVLDVPAFDMQLGYGVADDIDIEAGVGGEVLSIIPVPHSVWLGARQQWSLSPASTLGIAARAGYAGFLAYRQDEPRENSTVSMVTGSVSMSIETEVASDLRVLGSVAAMPAWVRPELENSPDELDDFFAAAYTATLALTYRNFGPFASGGVVDSDNPRGRDFFGVLGIAKTY